MPALTLRSEAAKPERPRCQGCGTGDALPEPPEPSFHLAPARVINRWLAKLLEQVQEALGQRLRRPPPIGAAVRPDAAQLNSRRTRAVMKCAPAPGGVAASQEQRVQVGEKREVRGFASGLPA